MLILVAVTVSYSIKSGLLTKAKEGGAQEQKEQERETLAAAVATVYDAVKGTITVSDLQEELNRSGDIWEVTGEGTYTVTSPNKNIFTVDSGKEPESQAGKTLNSNIDITAIYFDWDNNCYVDSEYKYGYYNGVIYNKKDSNEKIEIYFAGNNTSNNTNLFVEYYKESTLLNKYVFSNDSDALYSKGQYAYSYRYVYEELNTWTADSGETIYCECDYGNHAVYKKISELPVFTGEWVLDESSVTDTNSGILQLNVLIDAN